MLDQVAALLISIGINPTHLTAGLAGSFVRSVITTGKNRWEILTGSLVGTLSAVYLTPIVVSWFSLDASALSSTNGIAFGIGMIGMSLAEGGVRIAQRWANNPRLPNEISMKGFAEATNPDDDRAFQRKLALRKAAETPPNTPE